MRVRAKPGLEKLDRDGVTVDHHFACMTRAARRQDEFTDVGDDLWIFRSNKANGECPDEAAAIARNNY